MGKLKYSYEEKLEAVLQVLEGHNSVRFVASQLGTCHSHLRRWVRMYARYGSLGLQVKRRHYSEEFKITVVRYMYENHLSLPQTALQFGILNDAIVHRWKRIYDAHGEYGFYPLRLKNNKGMSSSRSQKKKKEEELSKEELLSELAFLRAENDYLKKLQALVRERILRESGNGQKSSKS